MSQLDISKADCLPLPRHATTLAGILLLLASVWSLSLLDASGKWLMAGGLPLLMLSWMRYVVHVVLLFAVVMPMRGRAILASRHPRQQLLRATCMLGATLSFFLTLHLLPQAEATAINFIAPLIVLCVAPMLLGEKPRLSRWLAAAVAFCGVLIIVRPGSGLPPAGIACGLLTALLFSGQHIATRLVADDDALTTLLWGGMFGAIVLTLLLPWTLSASIAIMRTFSPWQWAVLFSTGATGAVGHLLQIAAYRRAGASVLAPFIYTQIVSATVIGALVFGHWPSAASWLGIALVCASGMAAALAERRAPRG